MNKEQGDKGQVEQGDKVQMGVLWQIYGRKNMGLGGILPLLVNRYQREQENKEQGGEINDEVTNETNEEEGQGEDGVKEQEEEGVKEQGDKVGKEQGEEGEIWTYPKEFEIEHLVESGQYPVLLPKDSSPHFLQFWSLKHNRELVRRVLSLLYTEPDGLTCEIIARRLGTYQSSIWYILRALRDDGLVSFTPLETHLKRGEAENWGIWKVLPDKLDIVPVVPPADIRPTLWDIFNGELRMVRGRGRAVYDAHVLLAQKNDWGTYHATVGDLVQLSGCTPATVVRISRQLVRMGYIARLRRKGQTDVWQMLYLPDTSLVSTMLAWGVGGAHVFEAYLTHLFYARLLSLEGSPNLVGVNRLDDGRLEVIYRIYRRDLVYYSGVRRDTVDNLIYALVKLGVLRVHTPQEAVMSPRQLAIILPPSVCGWFFDPYRLANKQLDFSSRSCARRLIDNMIIHSHDALCGSAARGQGHGRFTSTLRHLFRLLLLSSHGLTRERLRLMSGLKDETLRKNLVILERWGIAKRVGGFWYLSPDIDLDELAERLGCKGSVQRKQDSCGRVPDDKRGVDTLTRMRRRMKRLRAAGRSIPSRRGLCMPQILGKKRDKEQGNKGDKEQGDEGIRGQEG